MIFNIVSAEEVIIDSCMELNEAKTYVLNYDLNDVEGVCFNVTSNNVVLDGNDSIVKGKLSSGAVGVFLFDVKNTTILNLNLKQFFRGLVGTNIENMIFSEGTISNSESSGMEINGARDVKISYSNFKTNTGYGLKISNTENLEISENKFNKNGNYAGLYIWNSSNLNIKDNSFDSNIGTAILFDYVENSIINRNNISNNNLTGIMLRSSNDNQISFNELINNKYVKYKIVS